MGDLLGIEMGLIRLAYILARRGGAMEGIRGSLSSVKEPTFCMVRISRTVTESNVVTPARKYG